MFRAFNLKVARFGEEMTQTSTGEIHCYFTIKKPTNIWTMNWNMRAKHCRNISNKKQSSGLLAAKITKSTTNPPGAQNTRKFSCETLEQLAHNRIRIF